MLLGACLDAGVPFDVIQATVQALDVGADLRVERVRRKGIEATKVTVLEAPTDPSAAHQHPHRHLASILRLIDRAALPAGVKQKASALFVRLGEAEAAVHGMPVERVHFHEVGAVDSIVDIVGGVAALEWLNARTFVSSPLNTGSGTVHCAHGEMPVPAPATARLLQGCPVYASTGPGELLTPTGALLVTGYAGAYGVLPPMVIERVGYGAGTRDTPDRPNVLRIVLGTAPAPAVDSTRGSETAVVVEAQVDDLNPQILGTVMTRLFEAGALDVFYTAVQMKKNRPGTLVTVLARPGDVRAVYDVLFTETTTLGVRRYDVAREALDREIVSIESMYGSVRMKLARRHGLVLNVAPEYDDCSRLASEAGVPVKEVLAAALQAWRTSEADPNR